MINRDKYENMSAEGHAALEGQKSIDGGPAFPVNEDFRHHKNFMLHEAAGLTVADYFAARVMPTLLRINKDAHPTVEIIRELANESYDIAWIMIQARERYYDRDH